MRELTMNEIEYVSGGWDNRNNPIPSEQSTKLPSWDDWDKTGLIPNGFSKFGNDGKFMRDNSGKVYLTQDYANFVNTTQAEGWGIDWKGVFKDLATIGLGSLGGISLGTTWYELVAAYGGIYMTTMDDLSKIPYTFTPDPNPGTDPFTTYWP